jgi:hypothetical protein
LLALNARVTLIAPTRGCFIVKKRRIFKKRRIKG